MAASLTETNCEKPPKVSKFRLLECCSVPRIFKNELKEKCVAECSNGTTKGNPWCCMTKCTLEETGIAVNGVIDNAQAKNVFKSLFANSTDALKVSTSSVKMSMKFFYKNIFSIQTRLLINARTIIVSGLPIFRLFHLNQYILVASQNDTQKDDCEHPEYAKFLTCVHREFFRNCLRQNPEASCKKIKDFVKKCPASREFLFES